MTRTQDDLKQASEHLHYEWDMLKSVAQAMVMNFAGAGVLNNAMLESFAVHVRSLIFFLFPENTKTDDVLATHFVSDPAAFETARGVKSEVLKKAQARAGKEVAYLTYERLKVTAETKPWRFVEIATEVNRVMKIFLQHADQSKLSETWAAATEQSDNVSGRRLTRRCSGRLPQKVFGAALKIGEAANSADLIR
jgi:hypothetical protein